MSTGLVLEDVVICIPVGALTASGFVEWRNSGSFTNDVEVSHDGSHLRLDFGAGDVVEAEAVEIPQEAKTLDGFRQWAHSDEFPTRGRISFLGEELLIDMSPESLHKHNQPKTEIYRVVGNVNRELDKGTFYSDRTLVTNELAGLSTEPDGVLVTWESFQHGRVKLVSQQTLPDDYRELQGSPDWILEVMSVSSRAIDPGRLQEQYHAARVLEYWLVNALGVEIEFRILNWSEEGYVSAESADGWQFSKLFGRWFLLTRERNRLGYWRYTLEVREM